jgi:hypothetical protein
MSQGLWIFVNGDDARASPTGSAQRADLLSARRFRGIGQPIKITSQAVQPLFDRSRRHRFG